uniref:Uncharacterized protein n=1 Tax=Anguilla anguilla TaxID=7936 RepID=A0A0E9R9I8_ANGAN
MQDDPGLSLTLGFPVWGGVCLFLFCGLLVWQW